MIRTRKRRKRGATLAEFAIVMIALLMMLLGIIDFSRLLLLRHLVDNAAREGARFATVNTTSKTTVDVQNYVKAYMIGQGYEAGTPVITVYKATTTGQNSGTWTLGQMGERIAVEVQTNYRALTPGIGLLVNSVPVKAKVITNCEAN